MPANITALQFGEYPISIIELIEELKIYDESLPIKLSDGISDIELKVHQYVGNYDAIAITRSLDETNITVKDLYNLLEKTLHDKYVKDEFNNILEVVADTCIYTSYDYDPGYPIIGTLLYKNIVYLVVYNRY